MNAQHVDLLLELIDQSYDRKAWHGPNLRGSIRGVSVDEAARRPGKHRHNIWEIVVHAAYWKYTVRRRLLGEKRGSFPLKGSNWFARPMETSERAWREDILLLDEIHQSLRTAVASIPPHRLQRLSSGSKHTHAMLIYGIASHDVYHAGQIQLLKRLVRT